MDNHGKIWIEVQKLPGVKLEDQINEIEKIINNSVQKNNIREQLKNPDTAFDVKVDETFVAEGIIAGITIWFLEKVAGKIFEEYIWPDMKEKIDGLIRKDGK